MISVVLCTYNGEKFLRQQLDSISQQTRLPDQALIRDDGSKDASVRIAKEWANTVPFAVRVEVNPENLRPARNFARAIGDVEGDLIVLSDQDDVWMPEKLEKMEHFFAADPTAEALFTDGWVVDAALNKCSLLSEKVKFQNASIQRDIAAGQIVRRLSLGNIATGATMALRSRLREAVLPLPQNLPPDILHDGWIALAAAVRGSLRFLDLPLILYRQHPAQAVGLDPRQGTPENDRNAILANAAREAQALAEIMHARFPDDPRILLPFDQLSAHGAFRSSRSPSLPRRIFPVLTRLALGHYHRYGQGLRNAIGDLLH